MIVVRRLNDSQFAVNPDLIERIHAHPDTTLVMVDGATYIVTESMSEIIEMIANYRAHVIALARLIPAESAHPGSLHSGSLHSGSLHSGSQHPASAHTGSQRLGLVALPDMSEQTAPTGETMAPSHSHPRTT